MEKMGQIEVICGPMFAGKTEELIRRIKTLQYGKKKIKVFKPRIDDRYSKTEIASHSGYRVECLFLRIVLHQPQLHLHYLRCDLIYL